jgi:hypothetical protein
MFVAIVGTINVLQSITRTYHMTCTFILMTQAGYRKGAILYLFSVSTWNAKRINVQNFYMHSQISLSICHTTTSWCSGFWNTAISAAQTTYCWMEELLQMTKLERNVVPMAHFNLWPVSDIILCRTWKTPIVFNVMFHSKLPLQILSVFATALYIQVSFYARLRSWKMSRQSQLHKSNTKFPFKTVYYLGVRGLTTSSYTVYNYTTSGHMVYLLYIQYIYISIQCTYISVQYMYFLLMQ